jgi:hypothetical protein
VVSLLVMRMNCRVDEPEGTHHYDASRKSGCLLIFEKERRA